MRVWPCRSFCIWRPASTNARLDRSHKAHNQGRVVIITFPAWFKVREDHILDLRRGLLQRCECTVIHGITEPEIGHWRGIPVFTAAAFLTVVADIQVTSVTATSTTSWWHPLLELFLLMVTTISCIADCPAGTSGASSVSAINNSTHKGHDQSRIVVVAFAPRLEAAENNILDLLWRACQCCKSAGIHGVPLPESLKLSIARPTTNFPATSPSIVSASTLPEAAIATATAVATPTTVPTITAAALSPAPPTLSSLSG
mmetsp:Transcript_82808/g.164364  ORF Transcript_82808/g.164364 Transcript_82808/m.164364 type:complete len:257 (-) Transcript_82808:730-1500(-)